MSLEDHIAAIQRFAPVPWDRIPDLGLYMDQVVTFIGQTCQPLYGEDVRSFISPAMINNYVKARLIPRPVGKKYGREQMALILMIVVLKQVCTMEDIRLLLTLRDGQSVESLYTAFCRRFSQVLHALRPESLEDLSPALDLAIRACSCRAGCVAALYGRDEA